MISLTLSTGLQHLTNNRRLEYVPANQQMDGKSYIYRGVSIVFRFPCKFKFPTRNEAHKQYSLVDTIFNYTSILDLQGNIYRQVEETDYPSAGFAGRRIVGLGDLRIDTSLEVQNTKIRIKYCI